MLEAAEGARTRGLLLADEYEQVREDLGSAPKARDWSERYLEEAADLEVLPDLDNAIAWTNRLVADIDAA